MPHWPILFVLAVRLALLGAVIGLAVALGSGPAECVKIGGAMPIAGQCP